MVWPNLRSYALENVAGHLNITFEHHKALEDARACAEIAVQACREKRTANLDTLAELLESERKSARKSFSPSPVFTPRVSTFNTDHPFHEKRVVFTDFNDEAKYAMRQLVCDHGGDTGRRVNRNTRFLVVQNYALDPGAYKTKNHSYAEQLQRKGFDIEVISETQWLGMLDSQVVAQVGGLQQDRSGLRGAEAKLSGLGYRPSAAGAHSCGCLLVILAALGAFVVMLLAVL